MGTKIKDLRNHKNFRTGAGKPVVDGMISRSYDLKDIHYATGHDSDIDYLKTTKMLIQEYQPQYPLYTEKLGDIGANFLKFISSKLPPAVAKLLDFATEAGGTIGANYYVDSVSENPSQLYTRSEDSGSSWYSKLFKADSLGAYEIPFFSDYMWEADGIGGWVTGDVTKQIGAGLANVAKNAAKINYPTTPNWEYTPNYPQVDFKFNLINDTTDNLQKNMKFLIAFTSGMLWVQLQNTTSLTGGMFKSPNVYSVTVPGRFRWYWSAISIKCKAVGKIFEDPDAVKKLGNIKAFTGIPAGFPEVIEVSVSVKSLVPNNFNTYIDYMVYGNQNTERSSKRVLDSITKGTKAAVNNVVPGITNLLNADAQRDSYLEKVLKSIGL